jgi:hypothetical protein
VYEFSTGISLEILRRTENPDFICAKSDGSSIGIKLTKVMRNPRYALYDRIVNKSKEMNTWEFLKTLNHI